MIMDLIATSGRSRYLLQCRRVHPLAIRSRNWWSIRFVLTSLYPCSYTQPKISAGKSSLVEAVSGVRQQIVCPIISLFILSSR
jgi:hypothetical protein